MGGSHFSDISERMIGAGWNPATPCVAVRWATRTSQRSIDGTLATLASAIEAAALTPPILILVGPVAALRQRFNWFERLPLFGQRIVITRDRTQASQLADKLYALGADVIELPVIEIRPPLDPEPLNQALAHLGEYDWLIFTSANGVKYFLERLDASAYDLRQLRARIAAIGPATRAAIEALHLKVDRMPKEYVAEGVLEAFAGEDLNGKRILLPRAAIARDTIPVELAKRGATIDVVETYRTVVPESATGRAAAVFAGKPDWITFTSSSTVKNLLAVAGHEKIAGVRIASIGPVTTETASRHGLNVTVQAEPYTMDGLVAAILRVSATKA
jgi:uroporphyrinogen III methyltransferase/synthase